jgi:hypothetical protein
MPLDRGGVRLGLEDLRASLLCWKVRSSVIRRVDLLADRSMRQNLESTSPTSAQNL